jgi:hypothetical protein
MALDSKIPEGPISEKWTNYKDHINLVNPANKRNPRRNHCGYGIGRRFCSSYFAELGYNVKAFASRIPRVARTRSQRKAESMQQKLPRRWRLHFQIVLRHRKKEGITAPGKPTYTVWQKCQQTSLTSVWRKACRWLANTADC